MNRTEYRAKILAYFHTHPQDGFKSRQLQRRLGISNGHEFEAMRDVLHTMVNKGELLWAKKKGYHMVSKKTKRLTGVLEIGRQGVGTVTAENGEKILVDKRLLGTALNGDTVEIALVASKHSKDGSAQFEGEIVGVIKRDHTLFVGTLERSGNFYCVLPDDNKISRDIYVPNDKLGGASPGDKVVVELTAWDDVHLNPEGKITDVFGKAGDPFVEVRSVIQQFRLPTSFPAQVEQEVSRWGKDIPKEEIEQRLDLRSATIVTIDPFDAKDFDDALSIELMSDGDARLGVHIADVSAYVRVGTEVDREAFERGTSVYLANQVIPMLPEKLSNELCSLKPHVDRLAYSCFMDISSQGKVKKYSFARSVINSKRRFTYEEVEEILDAKKGDFSEELLSLWKLAKGVRKRRMASGSIDFDSPEAKFKYDSKGKPNEILIKKRLKSHQLVEECMLLANRTVAEHVAQQERNAGISLLYTVCTRHPIPKKFKIYRCSSRNSDTR